MSNSFIAIASAKSSIPQLPPPLSPNIFKNTSSSSSSMSIPKNEEPHHDEDVPPKKSKYRMRICDAPPEILEIINSPEENNEPPSVINVSNNIMSDGSTCNDQKIQSFRKTDEKRRSFRKNPYPKKSPSKSSPGITLQVDIYTIFKKDPKALLQKNDQLTAHSTSSSGNSGSYSISQHSTRTKRKEINQSHISQFDELMRDIEQLNLDSTILNQAIPIPNWRGKPLHILHLPHYNILHQNEAHVASTLRIFPAQYLEAKFIFISTARKYVQRSLPFRKSDAQKLLKIDVNKASKLWEFFKQLKWI